MKREALTYSCQESYNVKREHGMLALYQKAVDPGGPGKTDKQVETVNNDSCRCKDASKMTPRELLRLMVNDLAFWKKAKKK